MSIKIFEMAIKYINIFQSQKNYPNGDFWFENKPSGNPVADLEKMHSKKQIRSNKNFKKAFSILSFEKLARGQHTHTHMSNFLAIHS
jgi:hypothetical protein